MSALSFLTIIMSFPCLSKGLGNERHSDNAQQRDEKRAIPQCFEESLLVLGIIAGYRKYPNSRSEA
jgi:hypothetical protein